ncbi:adenylate/guanylate cyclase domain-containing protein [Roseospira marina]|uniref:Adenylate/guanylate cyclase domain-containing protein n=1 Tax=Roseospira marina TaxID=140057 RepID=A0A5M6IBR2_9PROT|nr:adenylate/guanylate cyclase domain-containing protein [Roseospira marina]KAA5605683.1 adenylate/guanylate cyclase domain-containing protein [Roseospira marina]MBB4313236.1 adenylate cyclase [Roseospira marina]MBB5086023.1 adenylate cyclase [Roseospira marina]
MWRPQCLRAKLTALAWVVFAGILAGLLYVAFLASAELLPLTWQLLRNGVLNGATITGMIGVFEIFVWAGPIAAPLRRRSFPVRLLVKTTVYTCLVLAILIAYNVWLLPSAETTSAARRYVMTGLAQDTAFSLLIVLLIQFVMQMRRLIGGRVLANIVLGRYARPRREHRAFLFVDLVDSTAIARRLGDVETHALISRVFFDLDTVITAHGGEVHRYVGDEVVVTWPLDAALRDGRCLRCAVAIRERLARRASAYRRRFGVEPAIRAGLNGGPVVAGECGDARVEIVYFGDTINTAARLQQATRAMRHWLLVPTALIDRMPAIPGWSRTEVGTVTLRGRDDPIALCTLTPGAPPAEQPRAVDRRRAA